MMMKQSIALAAALTLVSALPLSAAQAVAKQPPPPLKTGTITIWDAATKKGAVKDTKGVETSFVWNDKTTVAGNAKVGEHAFVWYKQEKDGKLTATHISIGTRLAMQHATRPMDAKAPAPAPAKDGAK
jgi:uncharacterized protein YpmB